MNGSFDREHTALGWLSKTCRIRVSVQYSQTPCSLAKEPFISKQTHTQNLCECAIQSALKDVSNLCECAYRALETKLDLFFDMVWVCFDNMQGSSDRI